MTAQSRATLKSYFIKGNRPTQDQYGDLIDSFQLASGASNFLDKSGGAMTGSLQLYGVPTSALEAATKGYVDAIVSAGGAMAGGSNGQIQYNNAGGFGGLTVSGDATLASTGVFTLNNTTVSAGTYPLATVTVNSKGLVTGASNGSASTSIRTVTKQVFTGSGTYTPSSGMVYCIVEMIGGGGGGGGSTASSSSTGGGGGAGGYARETLAAGTVGSSQAVTIGGGGAGGANTGATGTSGGTTSLGALLQATGGSGGAGTGTGVALGGSAGVGSSADINARGGVGFPSTGSSGASGAGGISFFGGNGAPVTGNSSGGAAAANSGAGGSGASGSAGATGFVGGAGADGIMIITEFCTT